MRNVDDLVFTNIRRSRLHKISTRTPIMPCYEAIERVIKHTNVDIMTILNDEGRCVASYHGYELEKYSRLHELEKYMINDFMEKFHQSHDIRKILTSWWVEDKSFFGKSNGICTMLKLRDPYIYAIALMCKLYIDHNCIHFKDAWVLIVHIVIMI